MAVDISAYTSIETSLFVRLYVEYYKANAAASPSTQVLTFSDRNIPTTISGDNYVGIGKLLSISNSVSELTPSSNDVTISISGIPNSSISEIINSRIKGSNIKIMRGIYNTTTGQLVSGIGANPFNRFVGYVSNLSLDEEYDVNTRSSSNTLVLTCSNIVDVFANKVNGRKTNPESQKKYFASDVSMDRVPALENSFFDFGAKK